MTRTQEIAERLAKATPGPWYHRQVGEIDTGGVNLTRDWIADDPKFHTKIILPRHSLYGGPADYAFIANAPTDISYLLDRVAKLTEALEVIADKGPIEKPIPILTPDATPVTFAMYEVSEIARAALSETDT